MNKAINLFLELFYFSVQIIWIIYYGSAFKSDPEPQLTAILY